MMECVGYDVWELVVGLGLAAVGVVAMGIVTIVSWLETKRLRQKLKAHTLGCPMSADAPNTTRYDLAESSD